MCLKSVFMSLCTLFRFFRAARISPAQTNLTPRAGAFGFEFSPLPPSCAHFFRSCVSHARLTGCPSNQSIEWMIIHQIQRMVKLQKLKDTLTPASEEEDVTNEAWAEAAGETVESLREALEEGASAKQEMGET